MSLQGLGEELGYSYRWAVTTVSELMGAGFLERERHGREFIYSVTRPDGLDDRRSPAVHELSFLLRSHDDSGSGDESDASEIPVREFLRHEIECETQRLRHLQSECRRLDGALARARFILSAPS